MKGSFAKTHISVFIYFPKSSFHCALKGIQIKLVLVYSF